ncbi:MAG: thiolase domain-containing protein [Candidatus Natronoplasma sp.]
MRDVVIIGIGETEFGELWDKSLREIGIEAGLKALQDAGVSGDEVDRMYIGNMSAGKLIDQEHVAPLIADYAGLSHIPSTRVESGGASGGMALSEAYKTVASGMDDIVVVGGAEKMTDVGEEEAKKILSSTADQEWEIVFGATFDSLYAMMAKYHMDEYGTTREQLAEVAVKNHSNASKNPMAQFPRETNKDFVMGAPMVSEPLGMFDCAPLSDGGAALVLCPAERADEFEGTPIEIVSMGEGGDTMAVHEREDIGTLKATKRAAKKAYERADITAEDIDFAEVHDNFTITEIMAIEDLGFFDKGEGGPATEEGRTRLNSEISINTSGGLKAKGRPVGAVGISQAVEAVEQLRGDAGDRQVEDPEYGLTHNMGGTGASAVVHIFRRWA